MDEPTYYILLDTGHTLWKDRCTSAHAPAADSLDKSSAAIDRRIFHIPLEERLRARISDLEAWNETMLPIIRLSISEAQNQILTGHQDIRSFFSDKAAPVET
jgi:hypothetical protein